LRNQVGDGWTQDFKAEFPVATEGDIEHVAFFSQGSRWFLAVFANKAPHPCLHSALSLPLTRDGLLWWLMQALHVWNKHEKLGAVKAHSNKVDSLFFVRTGQNLVAINHAYCSLLASLSSLLY
jgi:hypothetical protein